MKRPQLSPGVSFELHLWSTYEMTKYGRLDLRAVNIEKNKFAKTVYFGAN